MTYEDIVSAWNAQTDFMNDWSNLSEEEKVEFALSLAGKVEKQEPKFFCNKCGYCGPSTEHNRPGTDVECGYFAYAIDPKIITPQPVGRQEPVACPYCDGTGDVHSPDGEWRGECDCGAAQYHMLDRLLRNSLGDEDYAEYSAALDKVSAPQPCPECEKLNKQISAYKNLTGSLEKQVAHHSAKADEYQAAIATLESERQSNAILTAELDKLKADVAELEGGRELNRCAIKNLKAERDHVQADVSRVYMEVTGGLCSKESTPAAVVISLFEDYLSKRVNEEVADIAKERDELAEELRLSKLNAGNWHKQFMAAMKERSSLADKLTSLQENCDNKQLQVEEIAEQVERMRRDIQRHCRYLDSDYEYCCGICGNKLEEAHHPDCSMSLPDLSTGILNRVRAETAERCAKACEEVRDDWVAADMNLKACAADYLVTHIRALAADMEAGK